MIVFEVFESHAHEYTLNKIFFEAAEVKKIGRKVSLLPICVFDKFSERLYDVV